MTQPAASDIAVLAAESRHQSLSLQRIEQKLDNSTADQERRLRDLEAAKVAMAIELAAIKVDLSPLKDDSKRWGAVAVLVSSVLSAILAYVLK